MTNQEVFTKVKNHLLSQMKHSKNGESCLYRGPDGLKCAIGALIPDDLYTPDLESNDIDHLLEICPEIASLFHGVDGELLAGLQILHDHQPPSQWSAELRAIAATYNLIY